jgi:hypothetical protein
MRKYASATGLSRHTRLQRAVHACNAKCERCIHRVDKNNES